MTDQPSEVSVGDAASLARERDRLITQGFTVLGQGFGRVTLSRQHRRHVETVVISIVPGYPSQEVAYGSAGMHQLYGNPVSEEVFSRPSETNRPRETRQPAAPKFEVSPDGYYWWDRSATMWVKIYDRLPSGSSVAPDGRRWYDGSDWHEVPDALIGSIRGTEPPRRAVSGRVVDEPAPTWTSSSGTWVPDATVRVQEGPRRPKKTELLSSPGPTKTVRLDAEPTSVAFVVVTNAHGSPVRHVLRSPTTVGRGAKVLGVDIDLSAVDGGESVSHKHATFMEIAGRWFVADLQSTNGTSVTHEGTESRVLETPVGLVSGDRLRLGSVRLEFDVQPFGESPQSQEPA